MLQLPNGCHCSNPAVSPKNWKKSGAKTDKPWFISYRFYDPAHARPKHVLMKGMNVFTRPDERKAVTVSLLEDLLTALTIEGYNPFTGKCVKPPPISEIHPDLYLIDALRAAQNKLKYVHKVLVDIKSILNALEKAIKSLQLRQLTVGKTTRKHMKLILEQVAAVNPKFSNKRFNQYRTYLMALFKELVEHEAIEVNPMRDISKQRVTRNLRRILSRAERKRIDEHLKARCPRFWVFTNIFYHSGGRETELMALRGANVDLVNQKYTCIVKKGYAKVVQRTITDVALPYWKKAMEDCAPDQVVFSKGLVPGDNFIRVDQIGRRWFKYVKTELKINCDFYALKHANTDELATILSLEDASRHNSHTNIQTTMRYAVNELDRLHERIKKVGNSFA